MLSNATNAWYNGLSLLPIAGNDIAIALGKRCSAGSQRQSA